MIGTDTEFMLFNFENNREEHPKTILDHFPENENIGIDGSWETCEVRTKAYPITLIGAIALESETIELMNKVIEETKYGVVFSYPDTSCGAHIHVSNVYATNWFIEYLKKYMEPYMKLNSEDRINSKYSRFSCMERPTKNRVEFKFLPSSVLVYDGLFALVAYGIAKAVIMFEADELSHVKEIFSILNDVGKSVINTDFAKYTTTHDRRVYEKLFAMDSLIKLRNREKHDVIYKAQKELQKIKGVIENE